MDFHIVSVIFDWTASNSDGRYDLHVIRCLMFYPLVN